MEINQTENHIVVRPNLENGGKLITTIADFYKDFDENYGNLKHINLILDFSSNKNISAKEISLFSDKSIEHKSNNKSFVIVCTDVKQDDLSDTLVVVPTLKEAEDVIEIEDIERDLGI